MVHDGLPITTLPQLFLDIAATEPLPTLRHALAKADYNRSLNVPAVTGAIRPGRPGSSALRKALADHQPRLAYTRSRLERAWIEICERAGFPIPEMNVRIAGWPVDAVWRDIRLVVELDGYGNHHTPAQLKRDRRKELDVRAARFDLIRYSAEQVFEQPAAVTADVRRQRARAD